MEITVDLSLGVDGTVFVATSTLHDDGSVTKHRASLPPGSSLMGYTQEVVDYAALAWTPDVIAAHIANMESRIPSVTSEQVVARLWQAAHDYECAQISGSAIGLLAMGVMTGKPKCLAVQAWIKSIWAEYYTRKAALTQDYDFSFAGQIPYTVPELMEEMGI